MQFLLDRPMSAPPKSTFSSSSSSVARWGHKAKPAWQDCTAPFLYNDKPMHFDVTFTPHRPQGGGSNRFDTKQGHFQHNYQNF